MTWEISSDVSPSNFIVLLVQFLSHSSKNTCGLPDKTASCLKYRHSRAFLPVLQGLFLKCFWLATNLKVLQLKRENVLQMQYGSREVWGASLRASVVMLPCLTAATEGRSCWPSSSQGALLGGCWSSPSPLSYRGLCAAVGEQKGGRYAQPAELFILLYACLGLYLSLKFPFFGFKFVFYLLRIVCRCLVPGHLPFKSVDLDKKSQKGAFGDLALSNLQFRRIFL